MPIKRLKSVSLIFAITLSFLTSCSSEEPSNPSKLTASGSHDIDFGKLIGVLRLEVLNLEINNYKTEEKPKELIRQCFLTNGAILKVNGSPTDIGNRRLLGKDRY